MSMKILTLSICLSLRDHCFSVVHHDHLLMSQATQVLFKGPFTFGLWWSYLTQLDEYFNSSIHCVDTVEQLDACNLVDEEHYSSVAFHIVVVAGTVVCGWA